MSDKLAPVPQDIRFDVEVALDLQVGIRPLPFPSMDKSGAAVCEFHLLGTGQLGDKLAPIAQKLIRLAVPTCGCPRGTMCPFRHVKGDRTVVCKHWLRGLCKKGDDCEFLHEYDMTKMPECYFYSKFYQCMNKECMFLHVDPASKVKDCPWYDRGFCRHGPNCKNRHVRRCLCMCYLAGFCLKGRDCEDIHPRFQLPTQQMQETAGPGGSTGAMRSSFVCDYCHGSGHKASNCFKLSPKDRAKYASPKNLRTTNRVVVGSAGFNTPLQEITCFKCGNRGHYANRCPRGLAQQGWNSGI